MSNKDFQVVEFPSKLLAYDGVDEIKLRTLTVGEVKRIRPLITTGKYFDVIDSLSNCVQGIHPKDFILGDFWFLLAWQRLNTFSTAEMPVGWKCPKCSCDNETSYNFESAKITYLTEGYKEPAIVTLPSGKDIGLRLARAGDSFDAVKYLKESLDMDEDSITEEHTYLPELALTICKRNNADTLAKRLAFLENSCEPEDILFLEDFQDEFTFGLNTSLTGHCKGCGFENSQLRSRFFFNDIIPSGHYRSNIRATVRFGQQTQPTSNE